MTSVASDNSQTPAGYPAPQVRTLVSFLIVVHFAAILAALVFTPGMSSELAQRIANIAGLRQYRQLLDMNLPYTYHLTFGGEDLDFDHQLEIDLELPDGQRKTVLIPSPDTWPRVRYNRYQMLAFNTALGIGQDNIESLLPQGIVSGLLQQTGAKRATLRCRLHAPLGRDRILAKADPLAADTWRTVYEATIWETADGQIRLLKQESASDSAPSATAQPASQTPEWTPPTLPNSPAPDPNSNPSPTPPANDNPPGGRQRMNRAPLVFPPSR